ncbi:Rv3235 family protein [Rugosimonospora africana]|uniref:Uncharacterized protein n=1 Tax=Rugosimonospora africana TaxID=556532 RepID=A0A8J3QLF3_9ACTN|nr:Rv3235 family protein [Rugosimonospora africana]GIH11989.1 hypothetical protein Raf01_01610 [Rugosimonospora africana]
MTTSLAIRTRPPQEATRRTAVGAVPLVRLRPAPSFEPPYDDEVVPAGDGWHHGCRHGRGPDRGLDPDPGEKAGSGALDHTEPAELPTPPAALPASPADGAPPRAVTGRHAAYRYVGLCLEVLEGFRPVGHLRRFTVPSAFESVADQLARPVARAGHQPPGEAAGATRQAGATGGTRQPGIAGGTRQAGNASGTRQAGTTGGTGQAGAEGGVRRAGFAVRTDVPGAGRHAGAPVRAGLPGQPDVTGRATLPGPSADRIRLRRTRVAEPRDGAVEAVAVLSRAGRTWALALRLEYREDTWLCTHVEVV